MGFWAFREGEDAIHRVFRVVVACALGARPQAPFGHCPSCPAADLCGSVKEGIVFAAGKRRSMER